jgi:hypothetical protein
MSGERAVLQDLLGSVPGVFVLFVLLVLAVMWFFLPFLVFGMKDRLVQLLAEARAGNALQREILEELRAARAQAGRGQGDREP